MVDGIEFIAIFEFLAIIEFIKFLMFIHLFGLFKKLFPNKWREDNAAYYGLESSSCNINKKVLQKSTLFQ